MPIFLLEILLPFLKKTIKYWLSGVIVLALGFYIHHRYVVMVKTNYDHGYSDAKAFYENKLKNQALQYQIAQVQLQQAYTAKVAQMQAVVNAAIEQAKAEEADAVAKLNLQKMQNNTLQSQLTEARHHVQLSTTDPTHPFSIGFVGLFNLATKNSQLPFSYSNGSASNSIEPKDIYKASFYDPGLGPLDLAKPASVTTDDVLRVVQTNMKIANQCIDDRKALKEYIDKLCSQGYCQ